MSTSRESMRRRALALVGATLAWDAIEAAVGLATGLLAGSIALTGFGLDSVIEMAAAAMLLRQLRLEIAGASAADTARNERRAYKFIGWTFLALALYLLVDASYTLWSGEAPMRSLTGIGLAVAALVVMPTLAWAKLRTARALESDALRAEAKESLACAYLSLALLGGLSAHAALGWWWADPVAALLMVPWLLHEGREALEEVRDE